MHRPYFDFFDEHRAFVDFGCGRFVYTDPHFKFVDGHRDCGFTALAKLREHVQMGLKRQGPFCGASSWDLLYLKVPKQPGSAGCGVCVLIMNYLMATEDVEAPYLLNEQTRWPLLQTRLLAFEPAFYCLSAQQRRESSPSASSHRN